ncbi:MAG: hypothetical protein VX254_02085 [Planctomycetota bacterium]|nr:hypothetical protein [Planctomycetota bacterium]
MSPSRKKITLFIPIPTRNNTPAKEQRTCFQRGRETTKLLKFLTSSPPFGEYTNPKKLKVQSSTGRKLLLLVPTTANKVEKKIQWTLKTHKMEP